LSLRLCEQNFHAKAQRFHAEGAKRIFGQVKRFWQFLLKTPIFNSNFLSPTSNPIVMSHINSTENSAVLATDALQRFLFKSDFSQNVQNKIRFAGYVFV
jgi:hypothetical protein